MSRSTVMVLDDEAANLKILPYALTREFPHLAIEAVQSPSLAVQRLEARDYGLLITDLRMPEMDGLAVLERVRVIRPETSVIVMSTHLTILQASQALERGAFDVLPKQISREELARIVHFGLEAYRARRVVKSRQLMLQRLDGEAAALETLLGTPRSQPPARVREHIRSSKVCTENSLASVRRSLELLTRRAQMLEEDLRESERQLRFSLMEAQVRATGRFESFSESLR